MEQRHPGQADRGRAGGPLSRRRPAIRDVLVHYLAERAAVLDYGSLVNQSQMLVALFWTDLERHHPGICSLNLPDDAAQAWKQRIHTLPDGRPRLNYHTVLLAVRSFYLDLRQWSLEDPARWAPWAAPCPVSEADVRGYVKETRLRQARMQQRTRTLAPVLPQLVAAAEERARLSRLLDAARDAAPGEQFTVDRPGTGAPAGATATGSPPRCSSHRRRRRDPGPVSTPTRGGQRLLGAAVIEVLRRTGVRIEELLELTHLSLRQYQAPTGEMVPLLQISPSKTDRERVIPADPDLVAVLARIIRRIKDHRRTGAAAVALRRPRANLRPAPAAPVPTPLPAPTGRHLAGAGPAHAHRPGRPGRHHRHRRNPAEVHPPRLPQDLRHRDRQQRPADPHRRETTRPPRPQHHPGVCCGLSAEVIRHYRRFVDQRRARRPSEEYREPTDAEWPEFRDHFSLRKVALGTCDRPYGTPCQHEHACVRCPMLRLDPAQLPRLLQIEVNTRERLEEAHQMQWLGEVAALEDSLRHIADKKQQAERLGQLAVDNDSDDLILG